MTEDNEPRHIGDGVVEYVYILVADDLDERIRAGEYSYATQLPSRRDLAARYRVGEMTIRRAMRELADRGMIRSMPARGTYVIWTGHA